MSRPLADRIRPRTLDEMVGQRHLLAPGMALRNIVEKTNKKLYRLNATTSGIADIKDMVADVGTLAAPNG
ncbi:MAG: replication-associated recombination protein A, partial [Clostridia bacterium]|nr:replication-associated recombination protein A [Clostridia bacterium]